MSLSNSDTVTNCIVHKKGTIIIVAVPIISNTGCVIYIVRNNQEMHINQVVN